MKMKITRLGVVREEITRLIVLREKENIFATSGVVKGRLIVLG